MSGKYFNGSDNTIQGNLISGSDLSTYGVAERNEDGTDRNAIIGNTISHTSSGATLIYGDGSYVSATVPMTIVQGTAGNDTLLGSADSEIFYGVAGNDTLNGGAGGDILVGGCRHRQTHRRYRRRYVPFHRSFRQLPQRNHKLR